MIKIKHKQTLGVGLLSIIVIFVIISLTVLGSLGVISARADYKLSQKNGEYIKAYYVAEKQAEEILASIHESRLSGEDFNIPVTYKVEDNSITYRVPIVDSQLLEVIISLEKDNKKDYQILAWHVVNTMEWQDEQPRFDDMIIEDEKGVGQ